MGEQNKLSKIKRFARANDTGGRTELHNTMRFKIESKLKPQQKQLSV